MVARGKREELLTEEVEAESEENMMLRRTLTSRNKETPKVDWKRKSVFQNKFKRKNKVCKVIVDLEDLPII